MDASFRDFVLDQLRELEGLEARRMFGGYGLYAKDVFFGILSGDNCYFRTDEKSRKEYQRLGMKPFSPSARQILKNYYQVPVDILEDQDKLCQWARTAVLCQIQKESKC